MGFIEIIQANVGMSVVIGALLFIAIMTFKTRAKKVANVNKGTLGFAFLILAGFPLIVAEAIGETKVTSELVKALTNKDADRIIENRNKDRKISLFLFIFSLYNIDYYFIKVLLYKN